MPWRRLWGEVQGEAWVEMRGQVRGAGYGGCLTASGYQGEGMSSCSCCQVCTACLQLLPGVHCRPAGVHCRARAGACMLSPEARLGTAQPLGQVRRPAASPLAAGPARLLVLLGTSWDH